MKTSDYRPVWTEQVARAIASLAGKKNAELPDTLEIAPETPPNSTLGDMAFPMFPLARIFKGNPAAIAAEVAQELGGAEIGGEVLATGPYVNIKLPRESVTASVIGEAIDLGDAYGTSDDLAGQRIMIEFSSPNTNKPLHLGHLRNDALGESVARILIASGAEVRKVNLINDRGIHICQSMLAYQELGDGETPESTGLKGDRLVGDFYVRYKALEENDPEAKNRARELLRLWEAGDPEVVALWKRMNEWVVTGVAETYRATGIEFDQVYLESETYSSGKSEVMRGLETGVFYREADGSVWIDLEDVKLDKKILLRGDGTSVYVTQDIGTVLARQDDWRFDRMIYVVASEQNYHFAVLFHVLEKLGYEWASQLYHLNYGMVNLPDGRMKSREGTVVDADVLIADLSAMAAQEIRSKDRESEVADVDATAHAIAIGALHYYLLQVTPSKDMIFNPQESLAFAGNTGPYLQYMCARISSMLRKASDQGIVLGTPEQTDWSALTEEDEWVLTRLIERFPEIVSQAAQDYSPSVVTGYLYDLAKAFSGYYHDHPILTADDTTVRKARLELTRVILQILRNGLGMLNIPFLEVM